MPEKSGKRQAASGTKDKKPAAKPIEILVHDAAAVARARRHLMRKDPVLKRIIAAVGPYTLEPNGGDRFGLLVRSIISQQISGKAAQAIHGRVHQALGKPGITPQAILKARDELLRGCGLSAGKLLALRDLAAKVHGGEAPLDRLHEMHDEDVIAALVPIRGIGRWTAQMFLIFALGRLDVLPVDDLGLRMGAKRHYELAQPPTRRELEEMAEPWRPYRTVATWYFWRSLGAVPQSQSGAAKEG
jgi:3-methyladenine DNA glycosylase/8-oxoguanine DNA glycosylase